jgi:protein TonB
MKISEKYIVFFAFLSFLFVASAQKDTPLEYVETMPSFPGGEKAMRDFIVHNIKWPSNSKKERLQGVVYLQFIVEKDVN